MSFDNITKGLPRATVRGHRPFLQPLQAGGMTLVVDQHSVGALRADAAHEPFGIAIRPRRPRRCPYHIDTFGGEHRVVDPGEAGEVAFGRADN